MPFDSAALVAGRLRPNKTDKRARRPSQRQSPPTWETLTGGAPIRSPVQSADWPPPLRASGRQTSGSRAALRRRSGGLSAAACERAGSNSCGADDEHITIWLTKRLSKRPTQWGLSAGWTPLSVCGQQISPELPDLPRSAQISPIAGGTRARAPNSPRLSGRSAANLSSLVGATSWQLRRQPRSQHTHTATHLWTRAWKRPSRRHRPAAPSERWTTSARPLIQ